MLGQGCDCCCRRFKPVKKRFQLTYGDQLQVTGVQREIMVSEAKEQRTKSTGAFQEHEHCWKSRRHTDVDAVVNTRLKIWIQSAGSLWVILDRRHNMPALLLQRVKQRRPIVGFLTQYEVWKKICEADSSPLYNHGTGAGDATYEIQRTKKYLAYK